MFGLDEDYGLLSPVPAPLRKSAALRGLQPTMAPLQPPMGAPSNDMITGFQNKADEFQQQATSLMNEKPDVSGYQQYAKQRSEQGGNALVMALAAARAGDQYKPVEGAMLQQAMAAQQPIQAGKAGMVTPQGDFIQDPSYAHENRIKLLTDTATKYETLAQRASDAQTRAFAQQQAQLLHAQLAEEQMSLRRSIADDQMATRKQVAGIYGIGPDGQPAALSPQDEAVAQAVANFQRPGFNDRSPRSTAIMSRALALNPSWSQPAYDARKKTELSFSTGPQGNSVRSFGVLQDHLQTLNDTIDALGNGNVQLFNAAKNKISQWTGGTAPTDFNGVKNIVADELTKAILGSSGALGDREAMAASLKSANSPAQLRSVINRYKDMANAQLGGLRRQYESSGLGDWESRYGAETHGGSAPAKGPDQGWSVVR